MPRYAPKITVDLLKATIAAYARQHDFEEDLDVEDYDDIDNIIAAGMMDCQFTTVHDDVQKVKVDYENVAVEKYLTLASGVSIALVSVGGDWEIPMLFAFYFDGKKFRGYVPSKGNVYNHTLKQAYGNADEDEDNADALKHYGVDNYYGLEPDFAAAIADIEARIEARGELTEVPFRGPGAKTVIKAALRAAEPDLSAMTEIDLKLLQAVVQPAAGGSYFTLHVKPSGRELTRAEAAKVVGIHQMFTADDRIASGRTWYAPDGVSSQRTAQILEQQGIEVDRENSYLRGMNTQIIYMR